VVISVSPPSPRDTAPLKILVTDRIMARFGAELGSAEDANSWQFGPSWSESEVIAALPDIDVLVCSAMTPAMAQAAHQLRLVHVTGAGYDKVPLDTLRAGVTVANTFHHAAPIAEHVIMVSLMLSRRVIPTDRSLRAGAWRTVGTDGSVPFHPSFRDLTVGLVGFGGIGQEVARLARSLGMPVRAIRQNPGGALPDGLTLDWVGGTGDLPELLATSDIVVVTVPLSDHTRGLINAEAFAALREGALLVNVARGPVVDLDALVGALESGRLGGAAIDVWWGAPSDTGEAPPSVARLSTFDNVVLTPHYSGHARSTFELRAGDIRANIASLVAGQPLINVVHTSA